MKIVATLLNTSLLIAGLAACSSTQPSDGPVACEKLYEAYVTASTVCATSDFHGPLPQKSLFLKNCTNAISAPGSNIGPAFVETCAAATSSAASCDDGPVDACRPTPGSLADGAGCADDSQCASTSCKISRSSPTEDDSEAGSRGSAAVGAKPGYCGTCEPTVPDGSPCGGSGSPPCARGLSCKGGKCSKITPVADGASCLTGSGDTLAALDCNKGSYCDTKFDKAGESTGTCKRTPTRGEACTTHCAGGSYCVGGICGDGVDAGGDCPKGIECKWSLQCISRKCVVPPVSPVDGPCGTSLDDEGMAIRRTCAEGLVCVPSDNGSLVCKQRIPEGGACVNVGGSSACDLLLVCVNGTCQLKDANLCK